MISVCGLSKHFVKKGFRNKKVEAISDISFVAEDGQITGLLGANGAGKSTTLRILATLFKPDSGKAFVDGFDVLEEPMRVRECIGYLPHDSGIYPRLTAEENIKYYAEIAGLSANTTHKRTQALVDLLNMEDFARRRAGGFSQGQKTKVALARAMIHEPKTLILDEPTNGLDVMATRNLREIILRLKSEGHCVLFSSHVMQEVSVLCDSIAIINDAKIALTGSVPTILERTGCEDLEDAFVAAIASRKDSVA